MIRHNEIDDNEMSQNAWDTPIAMQHAAMDEHEGDITYFEDFDNALSDIDFSDIRGDFKKSFKQANRKVRTKKRTAPRRKKPLSKEFSVNRRATIQSNRRKKLSRVIVPDDRKVIVQGVSDFILKQSKQTDTIRNIGYYKGEKLKHVVLTFNNNSALDFNLELFNPSMPLDYLQSTSLNLNNKIEVSGGQNGQITYSDILFNLLANPALFVNAQFVFSGPSVVQQMSIPLGVQNKSLNGISIINPIDIALKIDTMQFANNIVYFNIAESLNRPYVPDGMDVMSYKVLAGNTVTMAFFYKQVSLKKFMFEEARRSKILL